MPVVYRPQERGGVRAYSTWQEIKRPDSRDIVFMDNNVLACEHGLEQIDDMGGKNVRVDFNQGLDARLITDDVAKMLARLKWINYIRMSADTDAMLDVVLTAIDRLGKYGVKPYKVFVYVLVQDIISAERRAITLRNIGANPFAQPYRDFTTNAEPPLEQRQLARWVNHKAIFKTVPTFADYRARKNWVNTMQ